MPHDDSS
jgi:hypothetical protein